MNIIITTSTRKQIRKGLPEAASVTTELTTTLLPHLHFNALHRANQNGNNFQIYFFASPSFTPPLIPRQLLVQQRHIVIELRLVVVSGDRLSQTPAHRKGFHRELRPAFA